MNAFEYNDQTASQKANTMNIRAYSRNIPSSQLQPYLDARSVSTKYALLPIIDLRNSIDKPLKQQATFNPSHTFNPGNDFGPWSGFASNVNKESDLRGQLNAIQECSQAFYVPSSNSDLYKYGWQKNNSIVQPFPELFKKEHFSPFNPNPKSKEIGYGLFNNATRQQVKDLTKPTTISQETQVVQKNQKTQK
uniref:Uncharacterized protein n=1 Tax=viral metagenome TaxID=1070528 RepID=A0A6C0I8R6_9ZZZZ